MQSRHSRVAIVGSGFGGLGMAIRLAQRGERDFVIFERADRLGGVWRDNTYPGCACDVESHLYSFSFARNPSWTRAYSPQPEILAYLQACSRRFELAPHLRFGHTILECAWQPELDRWRISTSRGEYTADVLVSAGGGLSEPVLPNLRGMARFAGKLFHSARWDHDHDLTGRRVAVIGTGASAIQFVPAIQPKVGKLFVFQRTAPWILPRRDRALSPTTRRVLEASTIAQLAMRAAIYGYRELFALPLFDVRAARIGQRLAQRHLARAVSDPALRAKLTPSYTMGCKRVLISDDYLPAIQQPNVELVTSGIAEITADAIITTDGTTHEVDTIIFGTGFEVRDLPIARVIRGCEGTTLRDAWAGTMTAHLGTTVAGFPNLFLLQGPNTGLGHSSVIAMMESQIEHVLGALDHMARHDVAAIEPRPEVQAAFADEVQAKMKGTVWTAGGCQSWYLDANGRNTTLWPGFVTTFKRRVERFRPAEYVTRRVRRPRVRLGAIDRARGRLAIALTALPDRVQRKLAGKPVVLDGQTLAPDIKLVLAAMGKRENLSTGSPGQLRHHQRMAAAVAAGTPIELPVRELTVANRRARHYVADLGAPLVVFLHGGGFVFGDLDTHDRLCRMLCRHAGVHVLAIDYRLAPEHPFPAAVEDAERAYRWARRHAAELGADPSRVAVAGDSAGGNLATVVSQLTSGTLDAPSCQLLIYPTIDHEGTYPSKELFAEGFFLTRDVMGWFFEQYVETVGVAPDDHRLRPLVAPSLAGQPPALIITAGFDPLRDEGEAYAAALRAHGSQATVRRFESLIHGFANMTGVSRSASDAVIEIAGSLRAMLEGESVTAERPARHSGVHFESSASFGHGS
ncbi:MAG: alpha/beta hydrolase fold domain-containing protein [Kofleriaceae bacterium]